jgi:hypothetical protein
MPAAPPTPTGSDGLRGRPSGRIWNGSLPLALQNSPGVVARLYSDCHPKPEAVALAMRFNARHAVLDPVIQLVARHQGDHVRAENAMSFQRPAARLDAL